MTPEDRILLMNEFKSYKKHNKVSRHIPMLMEEIARNEISIQVLKKLCGTLYKENEELKLKIATFSENSNEKILCPK